MISQTWFDYEDIRISLNLPHPPKNSINFKSLLSIGDPLADAAYASRPRPGNPYKTFNAILESQQQNKLTVEEMGLLKQAETVPGWVDWESIKRGREVYWRNMAAVHTILLYGSLAGGFSIPRVNDVLVRTGYLSHPKHINRRLLETGQMINAVMQYGLEPGGEGWKSVLAVRFLHCSVRKRQTLVTEDGTSSIVPINQTDLIGTLLGFQSSVIIGLTRLWTHLTPQERNDYTHLWRYLGYLIGIKEEYNPLAHGFMASLGSFRDYLELFFSPDKTAAQLSNTLLRAVSSSPNPSSDIKRKLPPYPLGVAISRRFLSPVLADALELPNPSLTYKMWGLFFCLMVWVFGAVAYFPGFGGWIVGQRKRRMARFMRRLGRIEISYSPPVENVDGHIKAD